MTYNSTNSLRPPIDSKKRASSKSGIAIVVVIILYSYLNPVIFGVLGANYANYVFLNAIGSYALIVTSIIVFSPSRLETFRDHFSLWTIVLACLLSAISPGENILIYRSMFILLGTTLAIYLLVNRQNVEIPSLKSFFVGLFWSISAVMVIALTSALLGIKSSPIYSIDVIINTFRFQLAFVSVAEEALFRGLIFSLLMTNGVKENRALFIQAMLFWGMHYLDIGNLMSFFVVIPLGTLFMTLVIKKYKLLYLSIMMHTFLNVFVALLTMLITRYLF